jgi:AcrR family transcriptional regulator
MISARESTKMTYQSIKAQETRNKILHAALQVIDHSGVHSLTIDGVIAESGITRGGVQYHFRSKEALEIALLEKCTEDFLENVASRAGHNYTSTQWVLGMIDHTFDPTIEHKGLWKSLLESLGARESLREKGHEMFTLFLTHMQKAGLTMGQSLTLIMVLEAVATDAHQIPKPNLDALKIYHISLVEQASGQLDQGNSN